MKKNVTRRNDFSRYIIILCLSLIGAAVGAQSLNMKPLSADMLARRAKSLAAAAAQVTDAPVPCVADETKIAGLYAPGPVAVFLIGDKKLSEDIIKRAGKEPVSVGVLFFISLAPLSNGHPVAADTLRIVTVKGQEGDDRKLSLMHLAVVNEGGQPKLQFYAKGKQPLLETPLVAANGAGVVDIHAKPAEKGASLTLTFAGKYQATLPVAPQTW
ncbi:MAG: hypothetical protein NZT92_00795 [Abditibacteriales bacterium]|nr:hypothetical protein [Abditibacteriales bacterium]MDW8364931.1 hypothetical protein [Abditibacteriales bacterium]